MPDKFTGDPIAAAAGRILKPAAVLKRLRPVRLERAAWHLQERVWLARAVSLLAAHFPQEIGRLEARALADKLGPEVDWWTALERFLLCVEDADWFQIDWDMIERLGVWAMELSGDEGQEEPIRILGGYTQGIPAKCFGWETNEELEEESRIAAYPALKVLRDLLGTGPIDVDFLIEYELFDAVDEYDPDEAWERVDRIGPGLAAPLCWLPEMARFACDVSGNVILDTTIDETDLWPEQWTWAKDLDFLRAEWQRAKPVISRAWDFAARCDNAEALEGIVGVVVGFRE